MTNYYTFNNLSLVRRCLYLFAAADTNDKWFIPGYIYENPKYISGSWFLEEYALLFVASVCDYYNHTQDIETFNNLYPAVKRQMDAMHMTLDNDGIAMIADGCEAFIVWCKGLEKTTSLHGIYMYVLNNLTDVLDAINHKDKIVYQKRYKDAEKSAENTLYDKEKQSFLNTKDNYQYSVHSAVWMILDGTVAGDKAKEILFSALNSADSIKPFTPYMHHYVTEAMIKLGLLNDAEEYIKNYWGGMVSLGADTFYELYPRVFCTEVF